MRNPQVTMDFNTQMVVHDLDDLGVRHDLGNLHIFQEIHAKTIKNQNIQNHGQWTAQTHLIKAGSCTNDNPRLSSFRT